MFVNLMKALPCGSSLVFRQRGGLLVSSLRVLPNARRPLWIRARPFVRSRDPARAYTSNLFDCFDDLPTCLGGTFCTPCQVGRAASDAKAGDCCATGWIILGLSQLNQLLPGLGNVASGGYLAHIANRAASNYGIQEHTDVLTACFCAPRVSPMGHNGGYVGGGRNGGGACNPGRIRPPPRR